MNSNRYDEVAFTDSLQKAYGSYTTLKDQGWCAKNQTQYIKTRLDRYRARVNELRTSFFAQNNSLSMEALVLVGNLQEAFKLYFEAHTTAKALDFDGGGAYSQSRKLQNTEEELWAQAMILKEDLPNAFILINYLAYTQVSLMGDLKSEWDIRCGQQFLDHILTLSDDELDVVLFYLSMIGRGVLFLHKFIGTEPKHQNWVQDPNICYSIIFCEAFNAAQAIVGAIMPERVPVAHPNKEALKEFAYRQYVLLYRFQDFAPIFQAGKNYQLHITKELKEDPDRYQCFSYYNVNLRHDTPRSELQVHVQYKHLFTGDFISYLMKPMKIFKWMLKEPSTSNHTFDPSIRRWVFTHQKHDEGNARQIVAKNVEIQANVLKQMDKQDTTKKLVQILDMMPTLQIKLSKLQQNVVASNQNLLCLGRSGTGKTTTSVLRLFAQEILYAIIKKQQDKPKKVVQQPPIPSNLEENKNGEVVVEKKKKTLLHAGDLEKQTGMKMVFITASPVLTNEVRRFYGSLKSKLIHFLKQRDERIEQRKNQFQNITDQEAQDIVDQVIKEQASESVKIESMEEQERREILEFIQTEEKNLIDDLQIETQMNLPNSFDELKPWQFPLFITVKRLVYMMDACLSFSFFSRDNNNNIIGLDANLGWHNESKGVMMINHYFKESIDYDNQLAKFGKDLLEMDKELEIGDEMEEDQGDQGLNFKIINESQGTDGKKSYSSSYNNRQSSSGSKYYIEKQQLSFEVDYDIFESKFWPKIANRRCLKKLSCTLVWTEIFSVIKGGMKSCGFYMGYLPKSAYVKTEGSDFLTLNEKRLIYFLFLEYERWKAEQSAYDFMDVVNHLQKRLWYGDTLKRMSIDYLMVDEVQDLTPKTLQILLKLTSHNVFFAGDTAQTIAKGVGARFLDLRNIFIQLDFKVPQIVQLTKNYRSHGRILDLANSVVSLIELLFPKTIDKLVKEDSELDGLRPLIIMPLDAYHMRTFFTGTAMTSNIGDGQTIAAPQFGCNQVLIVRDQTAKEYIPEIFKNMLCLTVYEAKGLEFDDVILYNFFHLGDVQKSQWKLLNDIDVEEVQKIKYQDTLLDFDSLDAEKFEEFMKELKKQERGDKVEYETDLQLKLRKHRDEVYRKFSMLCIEMKVLYVAITRPKRRLIIYDDSADGRKPIQSYWEKCNVVDVITKDMIQNPATLNPKVREIFMTGELSSERSSVDQWRIQGIKLFKKKYYDAAIKCFINSGDDDLVKRCSAYQQADIGTQKLSDADSSTWKAKVYKHITKQEKRRLIKEAKKERAVSKKHFESAGVLFEQIKMLKHAASCFYTAKNFGKAGEIFVSLQYFGQAAECFMMIDELSKAAQLYEKANLVTKAIECYESNGDWEQLLHCLHRNKDFFKNEERQSLINKYVPVALNSLYKLYSGGNNSDGEEGEGLDEENKGKLQEMKIKLKYQKKVAVIAEEDEDEDSDEEDKQETEVEPVIEDESPVVEEVPLVKEDSEVVDEAKEASDEEIEIIEEEYDLLDEVFQLKKTKSAKEEAKKEEIAKKEALKAKNESFEVIDTSTKKEPEAVEKQEEIADTDPVEMNEDFELISQYDPDDEFLRSSKSVSIIDSILSKKSISQTSDFSIITDTKSKKIQSVISLSSSKSKNMIAFVESDRDIYAEDVITQKIIYYISLFSEDVSVHLQKIRSKKILFSNTSELQGNAEKQEELFILDLDDIDANFVNLILDVLEYYELFRLCLMLCNRYHMSDRLGRYLVSVSSKYSNLHLHRFNLKLLRSQQSLNEIWLQKQRMASIISHEALHNVFTLIEPNFLQVKQFREALTSTNSLGMETYREMLDLGFWKKLVYIGLESSTALQLCYKFYDREHFTLLANFLEAYPDQQQTIEQWSKQLLLKEYWMTTYKAIRDIKESNQYAVALKDTSAQYISSLSSEESMKSGSIIADIVKLHQWLFTPERKVEQFIKQGQKINLDQEKKLEEKVYKLDEDENYQIYEILQTQGLFSQKGEQFSRQFLSFQLCAVLGTPFYSKFLKNVRNYFDKEGVEQLIKTYTQTIQLLNMEREIKDNDTELTIDALYSIFLISSMKEDCEDQSQSLFKHYRESQMVMVNVNSSLLKEILALQQSIDAVAMNNFMAKKMAELRPRYFQVKNFRSAFIKEYKDFVNQFNQKKAFIQDKHLQSSYIIDMDSQFIMVPKNWVTKLIIIKLINMCLSLANELKFMTQEDFSKAEEESKTDFEQTYEDSLDKRLKEQQTIERVNQLAGYSKEIHEKYGDDIEKQDNQLMDKLKRNAEFASLVASYRNKAQFGSIKFAQFTASNQKSNQIGSLIDATLNYTFDLGIMYKRKAIQYSSEIINKGIIAFKKAISLEQYTSTTLDDEEPQMTYNLKLLVQAFAHFVVVDEYVIMLELIKSHLKDFKRIEDKSDQVKDIIWLLQKFLIAIDIHYYLKNGSIKNACASIIDFINSFSPFLQNLEKVKLLSTAFYLLTVSKFGEAYLPDYAMKFFDFGFNLQNYYDNSALQENVLSLHEMVDFQSDDKSSFEENERTIIEKQVDNLKIEKVEDEAVYILVLSSIIKVLDSMNKDERSAYFQASYIQIFNILMTVAVNDNKKSTKTVELLSKGFELITTSSYDEYFQHQGLTEFNYSNATGFNDLMKQFKDCEPEYKHQFFAASKFGGHMLANVNVKKSQSDEAQKSIQSNVDKAFFQEVRKLASHLHLSMILKRKIRQKRHHYYAIRRAKESFTFEERALAQELNIQALLTVEQLPGRQILDQIMKIHKKQMGLKQLIVCKYAVNSLDTHYILAMANQLQALHHMLLNTTIAFINDKGKILTEFEDLEFENNELAKSINSSKLRFLEIENEINTWMTLKAEPNLVEVERKSCKFKIKWESLKIYDKKVKLRAIAFKKQTITKDLQSGTA